MEILNTYFEMSQDKIRFFTVGWIITVIFASLVLLVFLENKIKKTLLGLIVPLISSVILIYHHIDYEKEAIHEILINDIEQYDFERYQIIEQNGQIFTVKEINE